MHGLTPRGSFNKLLYDILDVLNEFRGSNLPGYRTACVPGSHVDALTSLCMKLLSSPPQIPGLDPPSVPPDVLEITQMGEAEFQRLSDPPTCKESGSTIPADADESPEWVVIRGLDGVVVMAYHKGKRVV